MNTAPGLLEEQEYRQAGFSEQEIYDQRNEDVQEMNDAGFSGKEVQEYYGIPTPDMAAMRTYFGENLQKFNAEKQAKAANTEGLGAPPQQHSQEADGFIESFEAGFGGSVSGLMANGKMPDKVLASQAPMASRIASQIGTLAGDLPFMITGFAMGGGQITGTAAAFALPAAMRAALVEGYEKGDIRSFGDFWERSSAIAWETIKGGTTGAATAVAGGVGGAVAGKVGSAMAEIAAMTTVGSALEGRVPEPHEFVDAAILIGGLHGATKVTAKLHKTYAETGMTPQEVWKATETDPVLKQQFSYENKVATQPPISPELQTNASAGGTLPEPKTPGHQLEALIKENTPEVKPSAVVERTEAESKILEQVGEKSKPVKEGYSFDKAYTDFVDRLDPIKRAVEVLKQKGMEIAADLNPYSLARQANDYKAKVKYVLEKGVLDYQTLKNTGKSFNAIIEPHKADLPGLEAYLISKRALEVGSRVDAKGVKIESGFDLVAAREVVRQGKGKYEAAAVELVGFQNGVLKYLLDAGIVSKESHAAMVEAGKSYIPFARIAESEAGSGKSGKSRSLKAFTGSEKQIQSPLLSIVENTETLFRLAEKNRAVESFVRLAEKSEGQTLVEKVPTQMRAIEVKPEEVARAFGEGVTPQQLEAFKIFRGMSKDLAPNEFSVFRDGKQEIYRTTPELAEAFKKLDGDTVSMNVVFRLMRGISNVKRMGIALTPEFITKNIFRDQLTAGVFSKGGAIPFRDMVVALGDLVKKNDHYYNWLKSGGANGTFMELGQTYYEKNVAQLEKTTGYAEKTWNVLKTPVDFMRAAAELGEQATRLAEFKRVSGGATEGAKIFEGGFAAREVTIDFQRMGAKISAMNAITAFHNVSIQGLDRSIRAVAENPAGVTAKAATYITLPSVLLWFANKDDERYKELPRWQKDTFWIIPVDHWRYPESPKEMQGLPPYMIKDGKINVGPILRIPKPQELGIIFGSVPERLLEAFFNDNPHALKDFGDTMANLVTPTIVPDAISPAIETYFNKSLFTGSPIVSGAAEKNVLPELQATPYTTESGKLLSKVVAAVPGMRRSQLASPAVIENAIKSWSGTLGGYALELADRALTISGAVKPALKPAWTLSDIPFVKAFVIRNPSASAQSIQDFYENFEKSQQDLGSIKLLAKRGDIEGMRRLMGSAQLEGTMLKLNGFKEALGKQNRYIQWIYANEQMTRDEKRQQIDGVYYLMIETAKRGNQMIEQAKKSPPPPRPVIP